MSQFHRGLMVNGLGNSESDPVCVKSLGSESGDDTSESGDDTSEECIDVSDSGDDTSEIGDAVDERPVRRVSVDDYYADLFDKFERVIVRRDVSDTLSHQIDERSYKYHVAHDGPFAEKYPTHMRMTDANPYNIFRAAFSFALCDPHYPCTNELMNFICKKGGQREALKRLWAMTKKDGSWVPDHDDRSYTFPPIGCIVRQ